MYDPQDPNIYVVLDEGCNSTCHSKHWADCAEGKLKALGYDFPFNEARAKTFSGLGETGTSTEGSRVLPFSLNFADNTAVHGVLESHQLAIGKTPLLLSLHAQAHLGLVKDLKRGIVTIDSKVLPIFRCKQTGLLMIKVTPHNAVGSENDPNHVIPKCHRKFRSAFVATANMELFGEQFWSLRKAQQGLRNALESNTSAVIVTRGVRWGDTPSSGGRPVVSVKMDDLWNPDRDRTLNRHVGYHHAILQQLQESGEFLRKITRAVEEVTSRQHRTIMVDITCKSGRHRSVGGGFMLWKLLKCLGVSARLIHYHSCHWHEMQCGGKCHDCQDVHRSTETIQPLLNTLAPNSDILPRARGSVRRGLEKSGVIEQGYEEEMIDLVEAPTPGTTPSPWSTSPWREDAESQREPKAPPRPSSASVRPSSGRNPDPRDARIDALTGLVE